MAAVDAMRGLERFFKALRMCDALDDEEKKFHAGRLKMIWSYAVEIIVCHRLAVHEHSDHWDGNDRRWTVLTHPF